MNEPLPSGPHLQLVPKVLYNKHQCYAPVTPQLCMPTLAGVDDNDNNQEEESNSDDNGKDNFAFS